MRLDFSAMRMVFAVGAASLVAGCVQPVYLQPGPVQLQGYPPPVSYRGNSDYRPPISGPIPLQAPPVIQPLPPPTVTSQPPASEIPESDLGPIPVQDMPAPVSDAPADPAPAAAPAPTQAAPPEIIRKVPASGPGNNVPLEGFRPMKGQTRPAP